VILSAEILSNTPRKVRPTRIVYATIALGLILVGISLALMVEWRESRTMIVVSVLVDGLILIPTLMLPFRKFQRDARLLKAGVATRAKITSRSVATGRSGDNLALRYEFTDDAGRTISGSRVLWGDIQANGRTTDPKLLDALAAPTVFYDPEDPQKHLFYPSSVAEL
jgi:hypothetical protein